MAQAYAQRFMRAPAHASAARPRKHQRMADCQRPQRQQRRRRRASLILTFDIDGEREMPRQAANMPPLSRRYAMLPFSRPPRPASDSSAFHLLTMLLRAITRASPPFATLSAAFFTRVVHAVHAHRHASPIKRYYSVYRSATC